MIEMLDWDFIDDIAVSWSDVQPFFTMMVGVGVGIFAYIKYLKFNRCFIVQLPKR